MADDNVAQVFIKAEVADAKAQLDYMASSTSKTLNGLQGSFEKMGSGVSSAVKDMHSSVSGHLDALTATIGKVQGAFLAIGAVLAGGAIFKSCIDEFVKLNTEAKKLSGVLGSSVAEAGAFIEAYRRVGVSSDTVSQALKMLEKNLHTKSEQMIATAGKVGVEISANDSLTITYWKVIEALRGYKEGHDRNQAALDMLGARVGNVNSLLKSSQEATDAAAAHMKSLGITLDDVSVEKARNFKTGMADVGLVFDAVKYKIGSELIPTLIRLGQVFGKIGPDIIAVVGDLLKDINLACTDISGAWNFMAISTRVAWTQAKEIIVGAVNSFKAAISVGMDAAQAEWQSAINRAVLAAKKGGKELTEVAAEWKKGRADILAPPGGSPAAAPKGGASYDTGGGKGGGGGESIVAQWQNELNQLKAAEQAYQSQSLAMEKTFWAEKLATGKAATKAEEEDLKAREKASETARLQMEQNFWKDKLGAAKAGSKEYIDVENKILNLELQINRNRLQSEVDLIKSKIAANQASLKDTEAMISHEEALAKLDIEMKRSNVEYLAKMNKFSKAEELQELRKFLLAEQALIMASEQKKVAGYAKDTAEYKKHEKDMEVIAKQHQLAVQKIDQQISLAEQGTWSQVFDSIKSGFSGMISSLQQGTATVSSVLLDFVNTIGNAFANLFLEMAMNMIKSLLMGQTAKAAAGAVNVATSAGEGAAGGYASVMQAVPFPWNLAIAAGVAAMAFGAIMAFSPSVSAAGGMWDVPGVMTTTIHPKEQVWPAWAAEGVRNLIQGGGPGGGGNTVHAPINIEIHPRYPMTQSDCNALALKIVQPLNRELGRLGVPLLRDPAYT
jgi:hypothetical protein